MERPSWLSPKLLSGHEHVTNNSRSLFLRDFGSIIHSAKFRRLSHKTQVFLNPLSDYPRTRLTHSIEVSQVGRQLARVFLDLLDKSSFDASIARDFEDLVFSACLAHDIGQCPFGHKGEKVLQRMMEGLVSEANIFESNKQNIRVLVGSPARDGLGVSAALLDAILKYKPQIFESDNSHKHPGYYSYERSAVKGALAITGLENIRHPACYLMEAADDISYICGDSEDALKLGVISRKNLASLLIYVPVVDSQLKNTNENWEIILDGCANSGSYSTFLGKLMKSLVAAVTRSLEKTIKGASLSDTPKRLHETLYSSPEKFNLLYFDNTTLKDFKNKIYSDYILNNRSIVKNERLADQVLSELWKDLLPLAKADIEKIHKEPIFHIIPPDVQFLIRSIGKQPALHEERYSLLADYISGMTDRYSIELWSELNNPATLNVAS